MCLGQHLAKLKQKQQQLQDEAQQLTSTLTSSRQANVLARAKVAAAVTSTESELKGGQVVPADAVVPCCFDCCQCKLFRGPKHKSTVLACLPGTWWHQNAAAQHFI